MMSLVETQPPSNNYLVKLNYGFSAVKTDKVCIISSHITHVFHVTLPSQGDGVKRSEPNNTIRPCSTLCKQSAP